MRHCQKSAADMVCKRVCRVQLSEEAILKVLYLGLQRIAKNWTAPIPEWKRAFNQFALIVRDRVPTID